MHCGRHRAAFRWRPVRLAALLFGAAAVLPAAEPAVAGDQSPVDEPAANGAAAETAYDPLRGLRPDGSIPRITMPADIVHPRRWRYVPAGRLKPGNLLQRLLVTSFITPTFFVEEDVGVGGGVGITDIDFRNQSRREFLGFWASYSTEGQQNFKAVWSRALAHRALPDGGAIWEERSELRAELGYGKTLTRRFFGFGADSPAAAETSYTDEISVADIGIRRGLPEPGADLIGSLGAAYVHHNLAPGRVSAVPSTEERYPQLIVDGDSHDAVWLRAGLVYDRRDSQQQPYRGWSIGGRVDAAPLQSHGATGLLLHLGATAALPVPSFFHDGGAADEENPPTDTINCGAFVRSTIGELPFYNLPSLGGGSTLRSYVQNRFSDRSAWHASIEWRTWPIPRGVAITDSIRIERIGLAYFLDLGSVADDLGALPEATVQYSYGAGIRLAFERTAVFRLDYGISHDSRSFTATFGLTF